MAFYNYNCQCGAVVTQQFPIGTAPKEVSCECSLIAKRDYSGSGISVPGMYNVGADIAKRNAKMKKKQFVERGKR